MPTKIDTEVQLLRLLSSSSIQIDVTFLRTSTHQVKYGAEHLDRFYADFDTIKGQRFDAIIITGAPVEQLPFEEVDYWEELVEVVHWANDNVFAELFICWGAQAGLYIDFDVSKVIYPQKLFGIYPHNTSTPHRLTRGFGDTVQVPQSRYTGLNKQDLQHRIDQGKLISLVDSKDAGPNILITPHAHKTYVLGHFEYDRHTLDTEYKRDLERGLSTQIPLNYYPGDDPSKRPMQNWSAHANLFFDNWIDFVYQETPYDLGTLKPCEF
jgi:homoserine O-succinyltransferase